MCSVMIKNKVLFKVFLLKRKLIIDADSCQFRTSTTPLIHVC